MKQKFFFARFEGTKYTVEDDIDMRELLSISAWILEWKQSSQSRALTIRSLHLVKKGKKTTRLEPGHML